MKRLYISFLSVAQLKLKEVNVSHFIFCDDKISNLNNMFCVAELDFQRIDNFGVVTSDEMFYLCIKNTKLIQNN